MCSFTVSHPLAMAQINQLRCIVRLTAFALFFQVFITIQTSWPDNSEKFVTPEVVMDEVGTWDFSGWLNLLLTILCSFRVLLLDFLFSPLLSACTNQRCVLVHLRKWCGQFHGDD